MRFLSRSMFIALALASPVDAQTPTCPRSGSAVTIQAARDTAITCVLKSGAVTYKVSVTPAKPVIVPTPPPTPVPVPAPTPDPAPAIGVGEPVYTAIQKLLVQDEFDGYATFAQTVAAGWRSANNGTTQDLTTNAAGANQIVGPGYNGTGKAIRLVYDGRDNAGGQEAHAWGRDLTDQLAGKPGHTFYVSFYFRIVPGSGFTLDEGSAIRKGSQNLVKVKWLELWTGSGAGRAQFNTSYSTCVNDVPYAGAEGGFTGWAFYGTGSEPAGATCHGGQVRGPFAYQGQGQWHRTTYKYVTQSAPGKRDGVAQMWYDGTLIVSCAAPFVGVAVPGGLGSDGVHGNTPQHWCEPADIDNWFTSDWVQHLTLGSVSTSRLWPYAIDYDHMIVWRDP